MRTSPILALILLAPLLASLAFGAPADDPRPIVPASEILAKIERGEPVEYDGVIIVGDLDLSEVELPTKHVERSKDEIKYMGHIEEVKVVDSLIWIRYSEILGIVNFSNAEFQEAVSFRGTNFTGESLYFGSNFTSVAYFGEARFCSIVDFSGTVFNGRNNHDVCAHFGGAVFNVKDDFPIDANFWRAVFSGGEAYFAGAIFNTYDVDFREADFSGGDADFEEALFNGGDADFENAVFSGGYANFDGANFSRYANFKGAVFSGGDADFGDAVMSDVAWFNEAIFSGGDAFFSGTEFRGFITNFSRTEFSGGRADFIHAEFDGEADFRGAVFSGGDALFWKSVFTNGYAWFKEAEFSGGNVSFFRARFIDNDADFEEVKFSGGDADFERSVFSGGYVDFSRSVFSGGDAIFRMSDFSGADADFRRTMFYGGDADFREAKFSEGDANFGRAIFIGGNSDFRWADFSETVIFENSSFYATNLKLEDSKIYVLRLSNAKFDNLSTICLNRTNYQRLYVHWDSIRDALIYDGEVYLTLIKNFKNIEYFKDADDCYYHYRRERQSMKSWWEASKYIDILAWLTCGYGIRPSYTLVWSIIFISSFGIVFWTGNGIYRITVPYQNNAMEKAKKEWRFSSICHMVFNELHNILRKLREAPTILRKVLSALLKIRLSTLRRLPGRIWNASFVTDISLKDALYFSTMVFVSQPPHDWRPKEGWKYAVMLEDVLGWLLLALFLVTLGNVMIR